MAMTASDLINMFTSRKKTGRSHHFSFLQRSQ
jgi:hypothetical protein